MNRWWSRLSIGAGVVMLPWLAYLAVSLPSTARAAHWSLAWTGLDALEIAGLVGTGLLLRGRDPRARAAVTATAAATAALIVVDAWFDLTTAWTAQDVHSAVLLAVCVEVPAAVLLATLALRTAWAPAGVAGRGAAVAYLPGATIAGATIVGDGFRRAEPVARGAVDDAGDRAG